MAKRGAIILSAILNRSLVCCGVLLVCFCMGSQTRAQLPDTCKPPASAAHPPAGTQPARVYDAIGAWFAEKGDLKCAVVAFEQALRLEPRSAEAHFDLGLVRQRQEQPAAAAHEFRLALESDPGLLQARCALGSVVDPAEAESEFRKALELKPDLVCGLDGLAQVLLNEGRYDAALEYWRQAVRIEPNSVDLHLALATGTYKSAKARENAGMPPIDAAGVADAIRLFEELLKSHPESKAAHFTLANIYANEKRYREAADEYQQLTLRNPADTVALLAQVKALVNVSAFTEARVPAEDYVRKKPDDVSGHVLLGMVYRGLGDYAKAEPELERGGAGEPDDFDAQYQFGFVLAKQGKPQQALPYLRKAVALKPEEKSAQFQLAAVLRALGQKEEADRSIEQFRKTTDNEFRNSQLTSEGNKANELLESGKAADAAEIYRRMLEQDPQSAWTAYNLALALEGMHDSNGAKDALQTALKIDPKNSKATAELGRLALAAGDLQSAQKWLEAALDIDPQLVEARGNLAMVQARKGDLASAGRLLRQALEDDPKYMEGHLNLGLILAQQGRISDADQELDEAVALAPQNAATLSIVGKAEAQMGKSSQGIALLRKVAQLAPNLAAAHLDLALALADSYDLQGALEETTEAVRLAPQSGVAHFNRGRVLFDLGRSTEAQPELEAACRLVPQFAAARYFLALIKKQAGDLPGSSSLLEETVKLEPRNVMAWYLIGQCREQQSRSADAIAAWRQAIAIDPNFSQALFALAHALRPTDRAESERFMTRYTAVQKDRRILDRAATLANNGVVAASAHDWPEATRQLKEALAECGDCAVKADLHKKLGLIDCQAGDLDDGEKELLAANKLKPIDPEIQRALDLIALARKQSSASAAGKAH
jgi:tetratricopeptide (TPR) repeat protein